MPYLTADSIVCSSCVLPEPKARIELTIWASSTLTICRLKTPQNSAGERRIEVIAPPRLLVVVAAVVVLANCGMNAGSSRPSPTGYHWTGAQLVRPLAKPSFTLTDDHGKPFAFQRETTGKVTLLYFGYTHCPDLCPENMSLLAFAVRQLPPAIRSHIAVVFVTTDPARHTPTLLASWLGNFKRQLHRAHRRKAGRRPGASAGLPGLARAGESWEHLLRRPRRPDHRLHAGQPGAHHVLSRHASRRGGARPRPTGHPGLERQLF
jgi:SCO1/SenC